MPSMQQSSLNFDRNRSPSVNIVGGGLAGCLALIALKWRWPDLDVRVTSAPYEGTRTWCFHEGDVLPETWAWLTPFVSRSWQGYDVHFPKHSRTLDSRYYAICSEGFFARVREQYASAFIPSTENQTFDLTIRATGWPSEFDSSKFGWQKFVGLDLKLKRGHGLRRPVLKDARVEQIDGYRFFYCLPWSENSLLIEDTYYSNSPELNLETVRGRIFDFARQQGWEIDSEIRMEHGALPLDLGFKAKSPLADRENEISIGAASGLAHPVTGYTTSTLFQQIEAMLKGEPEGQTECDVKALVKKVREANQNLRRESRYFHLLNRMLFHAARSEERYVVLERFYQLSPELISRFYAARLNWTDRARILIGRPPVPLLPAVREFSMWRAEL